MSLPSAFRGLVLLLLLSGATAAHAAGLSALSGKYTGALVIAQGPSTRLVGNATITVKGAGKGGTVLIKGAINSVAFTQTIRFASNGGVTISSLLPGVSGFSQSASGSGRVRGKRAKAAFNTGSPNAGTLQVGIDFTTFGKTLTVSSVLTLDNGAEPIYVTIIGG